MGRPIRGGGAHDRHLLPPVVPGPQAAATQCGVPGRCLRRPCGRLPALPALPARVVDAGDAARCRDADRANDDRRHRARGRAVRLQRAADDAVPAGIRPPADRPDELRRCADARPRRGPAAASTSPAPATPSTCRSICRGVRSSSGSGRELRRIPYGETISYRELAERVDAGSAYRAVGRANGSNRLAVIVPCHRVIAAGGGLGGYGGGLDAKRWLLDLETGQLAASVA